MQRIIFALFYLLIVSSVNAADLPAKALLHCSGQNECEVQLNVKSDWKIYAHSTHASEALNFVLNSQESEHIQSIDINWNQQQTFKESYDGMEIEYYVSGSKIPFKLTTNADKYNLVLNVHYAACKDFCGVFQDKISLRGTSQNSGDSNILFMLFLALIGGFMLNLMPCVLPVIIMKAVHISKKSQKNLRVARIEVSMIFLGIMISFIALAFVTIFMKNLGHAVGWGLHFQEPIFVGLLAIVTFFAAINMFGGYEIKIPNFVLDRMNRFHRNTLSDFLHGIFIVLLATPCTAPFLSTAVAFSLTSSNYEILAVYMFIGLGLGLPYLIMVLYKGVFNLLPKPGAWMAKFKFVAGIPFIVTSLWMFYVLYKQVGNIYLIVSIICMMIALFLRQYLIFTLIIIACIIFFENKHHQVTSQDFQIERISHEVQNGKTVLVNITSDWCITCKVNEKLVLKDSAIESYLNNIGTVRITGDYTSNSPVIHAYLKQNKRVGIPLSVVYGPSAPNGIVLPIMLTKNELLNALKKASGGAV